MGNYSKLIGSIVGGLVGLGVMYGLLPAEMAHPEIVAGIATLIGGALATWAAPANRAA